MELRKQKLFTIIKNNKVLIENLSYLSVIQVFNLLIPLITLPYLLMVLGNTNYGYIVYSHTIISYFLIFVNFGFNISATKEISIYRNNREKLNEIVSSVLIIKGVFFLVSSLIVFAFSLTLNDSNLKILLLLSLYLCLYEWIFPIWYFQGVEKMKYITYINLLSKTFFLIFIFIFIKSKSDFLNVPMINGMGSILGGGLSLYLVFNKENISFKFQKFKTIKYYLEESFILFLGNIAGKIKILSNKAVLGLYVGMDVLAIYDIADKLKDVFILFLQLIVQVLFPSIVRSKNKIKVRKTIKLVFFTGILVYLMVYLTILIGTHYYFPDYKEICVIFLILGTLIVLQPLSYLISTTVLLVNGFKKEYTSNLYISAISYLIFLFICYIFEYITAYSLSISLVLSALISICAHVRVVLKKNKKDWIL